MNIVKAIEAYGSGSVSLMHAHCMSFVLWSLLYLHMW
jgi:hypothetical protein